MRCDGSAKAEQGAVAYDPSEFAAAVTGGVTDRAKLARVASQTILALLAAPESEDDLGFRAPGFLDGGGTARIRVHDLALGESACVGIGRFTKRVVGDADGLSVARVKVPDRTGFVGVAVDTADNSVATEGAVLSAKRLQFDLRAVIAPRGQQRVEVRGLSSGEHVTIRQDGVRVARGHAGTFGKFVATFSGPRASGQHAIKVTGQFADRTGSASYRVR